MKLKKTIGVLLLMLMVSCQSIDKNALEQQVRSDINEQFSKEASAYGISYTIKSFHLTHVSGNEYLGALNTVEDGEEFVYQVYVTYDGSSYFWQIVD